MGRQNRWTTKLVTPGNIRYAQYIEKKDNTGLPAKALQKQALKDLHKQMGSEFTPILYQICFPPILAEHIPPGQRGTGGREGGGGTDWAIRRGFPVGSVCRIKSRIENLGDSKQNGTETWIREVQRQTTPLGDIITAWIQRTREKWKNKTTLTFCDLAIHEHITNKNTEFS